MPIRQRLAPFLEKAGAAFSACVEGWSAKCAPLAKRVREAAGGPERRRAAQEQALRLSRLIEDMKLRDAVESGRKESIEGLIAAGFVVRPSSLALQAAAQNGSIELLRALAGAFEPGSRDDRAFFFAAMRGRSECLDELLPISSFGLMGGSAMAMAARGGHAACVFKLAQAMMKEPEASRLIFLAAEEARFVGQDGLARDIEAMWLALAEKSDMESAIEGAFNSAAKKTSSRL